MHQGLFRTACIAALALTLVSSAPGAQVSSKTFCVSGASDGSSWSWTLGAVGGFATQFGTTSVGAGGDATALAQEWVQSINDSTSSSKGFTAEFRCTDPGGDAYFTVHSSSLTDFMFTADGCTITGNPAGCSFNPTVTEVPASQLGPCLCTDDTLCFSGGLLGGAVTYELDGGPGQIYGLLPSFNTGPTPLAFVDPLDPRVLEVGLDLMPFWSFGVIPPSGHVSVFLPIPLAPAGQGFPLHAQAVTIPGFPTLVDDISNRNSFALSQAQSTTFTLGAQLDSIDIHTATRVGDGRVIIAGGLGLDPMGNALALDGFHSYDPSTEVFSPAGGTMAHPRVLHSTVRLNDGRILLTGGLDELNVIRDTVDIWDPATETVTPAAPMSTPRTVHTATRLCDGRVLVVGGASLFDTVTPTNSTVEATSEIYNPATNSWSPGPSLPNPRIGHQATLMNDGRVLITGGLEITVLFGVPVPTISNDCTRYDPATNGFVATSNFVGERALHAQVLLDNGDVLVTGGAIGDVAMLTATPLNTCRRYNAATNSWTNVASMANARGFHSMVNLDGTILVLGGMDSVDIMALSATAVTDVESTNQLVLFWSPAGSTLLERPLTIPAVLEGNGRVLLTGSGDNGDPLTPDFTAEVYHK